MELLTSSVSLTSGLYGSVFRIQICTNWFIDTNNLQLYQYTWTLNPSQLITKLQPTYLCQNLNMDDADEFDEELESILLLADVL